MNVQALRTTCDELRWLRTFETPCLGLTDLRRRDRAQLTTSAIQLYHNHILSVVRLRAPILVKCPVVKHG